MTYKKPKAIFAIILLCILFPFGCSLFGEDIYFQPQSPLTRDIILFYQKNPYFSDDTREQVICTVEKENKDDLASRSNIANLKIKKHVANNNLGEGEAFGKVFANHISLGTSINDALR